MDIKDITKYCKDNRRGFEFHDDGNIVIYIYGRYDKLITSEELEKLIAGQPQVGETWEWKENAQGAVMSGDRVEIMLNSSTSICYKYLTTRSGIVTDELFTKSICNFMLYAKKVK